MAIARLDFLIGTMSAAAATSVTLPFANGTRPLVAFPQKRKLIMLSPRPPLLETPFSVFDESLLTPNDAFFVRWHLSGIPTTVDGDAHRIKVHGSVKRPLNLSVEDLRTKYERAEIIAVNQCSGNSRGLFSPRVPGGQWDNGAMGNARWTGVRLLDVLKSAGLGDSAVQIRFRGLDAPVLPTTPAFIKALSIDDLTENMLIAYEMNGAPLPVLNGYPVRLIVPGWYSTYWMKMLSEIEAIDTIDDNFWMKTAYRIPDTPNHSVLPTDKGYPTVPINKLAIRSFMTNVTNGQTLKPAPQTIRGIAFNDGERLKTVEFSSDGGATWRPAKLGPNHGNFSFRQWSVDFTPQRGRSYVLACRATAINGATQTNVPVWNPGGYMLNTIETYNVGVA